MSHATRKHIRNALIRDFAKRTSTDYKQNKNLMRLFKMYFMIIPTNPAQNYGSFGSMVNRSYYKVTILSINIHDALPTPFMLSAMECVSAYLYAIHKYLCNATQ